MFGRSSARATARAQNVAARIEREQDGERLAALVAQQALAVTRAVEAMRRDTSAGRVIDAMWAADTAYGATTDAWNAGLRPGRPAKGRPHPMDVWRNHRSRWIEVRTACFHRAAELRWGNPELSDQDVWLECLSVLIRMYGARMNQPRPQAVQVFDDIAWDALKAKYPDGNLTADQWREEWTAAKAASEARLRAR